MGKPILFLILALGVCADAGADIWSWVDANGVKHYVSSNRPIYTWLDDDRKVHFADKPGHERAARVRLAWHSSGDLPKNADTDDTLESAVAGRQESEQEDAAQKLVESRYCNQATEVYNSYLGAKKLYTTNKRGDRDYLSKLQKKRKMAETKAAMDQWCQ